MELGLERKNVLVTGGLEEAGAARRTERVSEGLRAEARRLGITEQEALQRTVARLPLGRLAERGLDARTTSRRRRLSNALRPPACVASR